MELRILGPIEAWHSGEEIRLDGTKQRTFLASLLLGQGRIVHDVRLAEHLWGTNPPSTLDAQLYTYASRLRSYLDGHVRVVRRAPGYLLHTDGAWIDIVEFDRQRRRGDAARDEGHHAAAAAAYRDALALWRGPALAGGADPLISAEAAALEETRLAVLERRIEAEVELGRAVELLPELRSLVSCHPLHEGFRASLMTALYGANRQSEALLEYDKMRRILQEELGVYPGPGLSRLFQGILAGELPQKVA